MAYMVIVAVLTQGSVCRTKECAGLGGCASLRPSMDAPVLEWTSAQPDQDSSLHGKVSDMTGTLATMLALLTTTALGQDYCAITPDHTACGPQVHVAKLSHVA